jgi:hypothetical protein
MTGLAAESTQCPRGTLVAQVNGAKLLIPAGCKRWPCPNCGWKNARKLAGRIMATPCRRFATFTIRFDPLTDPVEELDRMNRAWRLLWKRIKRRQGQQARGYVKVIELQKNGTPHLHIALDCGFISQRWLSSQWLELSGSPVVDIRIIRTQRGLARYLAKYLTKASEAVASRRKFSASRAFLPPWEKPPREQGDLEPSWSYSRAPADRLERALVEQGWRPWNGWYLQPSAALSAL